MKPAHVAIGVVVVGAVALAAMFRARHSVMERLRQELEAAVRDGGASTRSGPEAVLQLPQIIGQFERDGIAVALGNDTSDRTVVIDAVQDRLVIEYRSISSGPLVRHVAVDGRTLAPGEATAPFFIPLEARSGSVKVHFEKRDQWGVYRTDKTIR